MPTLSEYVRKHSKNQLVIRARITTERQCAQPPLVGSPRTSMTYVVVAGTPKGKTWAYIEYYAYEYHENDGFIPPELKVSWFDEESGYKEMNDLINGWGERSNGHWNQQAIVAVNQKPFKSFDYQPISPDSLLLLQHYAAIQAMVGVEVERVRPLTHHGQHLMDVHHRLAQLRNQRMEDLCRHLSGIASSMQ
jgi:hypothetical protein